MLQLTDLAQLVIGSLILMRRKALKPVLDLESRFKKSF